eukprot:3209742-Rhodomonas_salina.1
MRLAAYGRRVGRDLPPGISLRHRYTQSAYATDMLSAYAADTLSAYVEEKLCLCHRYAAPSTDVAYATTRRTQFLYRFGRTHSRVRRSTQSVPAPYDPTRRPCVARYKTEAAAQY